MQSSPSQGVHVIRRFDNGSGVVPGNQANAEEVSQTNQQTDVALSRILIIEDDESHVLALTLGLEREGFTVSAVGDGRKAFDAATTFEPDIILLDIMLPGMSGLDVCRQLRDCGMQTPIIMVSSRAEELDVVVGIEVGADDYVAKPYRMRELVARINAVLRRHAANTKTDLPIAPETRSHQSDVLRIGEVELENARHEVRVRNVKIDVPLREFQLLRELMEHAGHVVTREELIDNIWGYGYSGDARIIATLVGRLRSKIDPDPDSSRHISTIRGVGYRFNDRY